ncbi:MAG: tail fiber protein [Desulfuromonadales bacterium]|nr:tail fiber protein [Desulfuromonadales bacterium]
MSNLFKRLFVTGAMAAMLTVAIPLFAAGVPTILSYQGFLTDSSSQPITGQKTITINLYSVPSGGTFFWSETQTVNVRNGNFAVALGNINPLNPTQFSSNVYVGLTLGSDSEMTPRQTLVSVPFAFNANNGVPQGVIVMWSGAINQIPSGWALCNGTAGTPDLRDRFVVGAGNTYIPGTTGGNTTINLQHGHIINDHTHSGTTGSSNSNKSRNEGSSSSFTLPETAHGHSFTTGGASDRGTSSSLSTAQDVRPPYYALAYIMKL